MATVIHPLKLSARLASRHTASHATRRAFHRSARHAAASNFTMPALSPTMTEGNIAAWRVAEGDSFSAGDVLLEIETDKATMDVEAQDDGVMVKHFEGEGAKGVKVGSRIAVIAESGDDPKSIEIPKKEGGKVEGGARKTERPSPQDELKGGIDGTESSPSAAEAPPSSRPEADAEAGGAFDTRSSPSSTSSSSSSASHGGRKKQSYPLYPSVEHLLHTNGLSASDASSIPASGPNGRLLKGDVLAHLGRIKKEYPQAQEARMRKLGHLDLSNITLAPPPQRPAAAAKEEVKEVELPKDTELAVPISLSAVIATQKRVNDTLGIFLPLSTFIARASELANADLPLAKNRTPTADELFNSVLGLDKVAGAFSKLSRGHYVPNVTGLLPTPPLASRAAARKGKKDVFDELLGGKVKRRPAGAVGIAAGENVFSVTAKLGEEKRAGVFLERMKMALEKEPGRLVL